MAVCFLIIKKCFFIITISIEQNAPVRKNQTQDYHVIFLVKQEDQKMPNHQGHHTKPSQIFSKTSLNKDINGSNLSRNFFHPVICRSGVIVFLF